MANSEAPDVLRSYAHRGGPRGQDPHIHGRATELDHASRMTSLTGMGATIAHEVNQPLAAIMAYAEASLRWLSHDEPNLAKVAQLLRHIVSDARRASDIVQSVRKMATTHEPELSPLDLNEVVEEALPIVRHELKSRSIKLSVRLGAGLPIVLGNRIQLQQVIVNLLVNGMHAITRAGRPLRRIDLETGTDESDVVAFSVRDSGTGIAVENLDRVFESFFTTKAGGMGIGLAICHSIITAYGGSIAASNHPEGGALFRFTLSAMRSPLHG